MRKLILSCLLLLTLGTKAQGDVITLPIKKVTTEMVTISKTETDTVNKLLGLTTLQYNNVYQIYLQENSRIENAKVHYSTSSVEYLNEVSVAKNTSEQLIYQQLNNLQQIKWMDIIRAKHSTNK